MENTTASNADRTRSVDYVESIWRSLFNNGGNHLGDLSGTNYQENYLVENLREANTELGAAANQNNPVRINAASHVLEGGRENITQAEAVEWIIERIFVLMNAINGFRVFNKLIESVDDHQFQLIVAKITSQPESLINASLSPYGSKSVQRLIKALGKETLISEVISALSTDHGFYRLMTSTMGSSVILKCLDVASTEQNQLLYEAAIRYCLDLAKHERGCISLKKFITSSRGLGRYQLLDLIATYSLHLSQDPSGNYVLQHVLGLQDPVLTDKICSLLRGHYVQLSSQKGGSHVVERCLDSPGMNYVLLDLITGNKIFQLARNRYGNYVIQTALKATKRENSRLHQVLLTLLQRHSDALRSGYGNNVLKLIDRGVPLN